MNSFISSKLLTIAGLALVFTSWTYFMGVGWALVLVGVAVAALWLIDYCMCLFDAIDPEDEPSDWWGR